MARKSFNQMKILVPSSVFPTQKNKLIQYVYNIKNTAKNSDDVKLIWIVCQPSTFKNTEFEKDLVIDIHQFKNAIQVLNEINPDCVLTNNNSKEALTMSFILAANNTKTPLVYYYLNDQTPILGKGAYKSQKENLTIQLRNVLSEKTAMDSDEKKKPLRRGLFLMYKNKFLMRTRRKVGIGFVRAIRDFFNDMSSFIFYKRSIWNNLADLSLCSNQDLFEFWTNVGVDKDKIVFTGSPYWDKIFEKIQKLKKQEIKNDGKIKVLIVTGGMVEHGVWTQNERDFYLKELFKTLNTDNKILYDIKIHPASESKIFYQNFFEQNKINAKIYQHENLFDTMRDYDIIISYGSSSVHTECAYGGIKMILLDINWNYRRVNLVDEAIRSKYFMHCKEFNQLVSMINQLYKKEVEFSDELIQARERMSYKFDGKAGERALMAIYNICKIKNKKC